jgi:tRNA-modifying protein YgfZ
MSYVSPEHHIVTFEGVDALAFLQSQLTNDVASLQIGDWQWQGYCNAKGRLHATFALARLQAGERDGTRTGEQSYAAIVHTSVSAFLMKRLTMFRLRSKVAIAISDTLCAVHHFQPVSNSGAVATLDLGHGRWVTLEQKSDSQLFGVPPNLIGRWKQIGIESKQPEVVAQTNELFVPQMIGWDTVHPRGGVSFSKGCYPGQEVVARAHYRGAVKRRLARTAVPASVEPGATFQRDDNSEVDIVNVAPGNDDNSLIALVVEPIPG